MKLMLEKWQRCTSSSYSTKYVNPDMTVNQLEGYCIKPKFSIFSTQIELWYGSIQEEISWSIYNLGFWNAMIFSNQQREFLEHTTYRRLYILSFFILDNQVGCVKNYRNLWSRFMLTIWSVFKFLQLDFPGSI